MSITRNRELSQFGSFIYIDNNSQEIGISTGITPYVGIGTTNPSVKFEVVGDSKLNGNLNVVGGTIDASSYRLNGSPLVSAAVLQWNFGTNPNDIYRLNGSVGIGTSVLQERLTVGGKVAASQFVSNVLTGTAPLVVNSETVVTNLNAFYLRGGVPGQDINSNDIVTRGGTQSLSNKTLISPTITSIINNGTKTVPTGTGSFVITGSVGVVTAGMIAQGAITNDKIDNNAVISYSKLSLNNSILGSDIAANAAIPYSKLNLSNSIVGSDIVNGTITNNKLQNSTISGISLGSNLSTLTFGTYLQVSGTSYNGSADVAIELNASSLSNASTVVARDSLGNFSANTITANTFSGNGTIPIGGIIMWSGSIVSVPSGWSLCDGSNGTPDLRDRFIVGAGRNYAVAGVGGTTDSVVVSHTHTGTTNNAGIHSHNYTYRSTEAGLISVGFTDIGSDATITGITSTAGDHTHTFTTNSSGESGLNKNLPPYYALAFIMRIL